MKILMTGATGFIGKHLAARLARDGYSLVALVRDRTNAREILPSGCELFEWDAARAVPPDALEGVNGVIHLAGYPVSERRWSAEVKTLIHDTRVLGSRALVSAIMDRALEGKSLPSVMVSASAIGFYGDRGEVWLRDGDAPGQGFLSEVCLGWEGETLNLKLEEWGVRAVALRTGLVLGADGGLLAKMIPVFRAGLGGKLGSGDQWMSWIHVEDLVSVYVEALENPRYLGAINAVSPEPVRNEEFSDTLADVLHRPSWLGLPGWGLRLALGEMGSVIPASQRVTAEKLQGLGFRFDYRELRDALARICQRPEPREEDRADAA